MYRITTNNRALWDPAAGITLLDPSLSLQLNTAGLLTFGIDPTHHLYGSLEKHASYIDITQDGKWLWSGRVLNTTADMNNMISVEAEGELAYLNDTIQRPKEYHNLSIRDYLADVINIHNTQVDSRKQFTVGLVTVTDSNNSIYKISNYDSTWELLNTQLLEALGGFFRIRHENGARYLDYLKEFGNISTQHIAYGENLLDLVSDVRGEEFATAILPLGAADQETEEKLTIKSVNGGKDYIQDDELVERFGFLLKVTEHDDVTLPQNLLTKGYQDLDACKYFKGSLEVTPVDLHLIDDSVESFRLGDLVFLESGPHGIRTTLSLTRMTLPFASPDSMELVLGMEWETLTDSKLHADKRIDEIHADYVKNETLTETVTKTVDAAVDGIEIGGRNLIRDSSMEIGQGWGTYAYVAENEGADGGKCFKVSNPQTIVTISQNESIRQQLFREGYFRAGDTYVLSYWAKTENLAFGATNPLLSLYIEGSSSGAITMSASTNLTKLVSGTTEWARYHSVVTIPDVNIDKLSNLCFFFRDFTGTVWVDKAQITRGNKLTDWSPAPEDAEAMVDNKTQDIQLAVERNTSLINQTADSIKLEVEQTYVKGDDFESYKSTAMSQTAEQIEFVFQNATDRISSVEDAISGNQELLESYIRFKDALIELGRVGNDFTAELDNKALRFMQSGQTIAYISNNKLYITDAEVTNSLRIGSFAFLPRSNRNLSLKWVGGF